MTGQVFFVKSYLTQSSRAENPDGHIACELEDFVHSMTSPKVESVGGLLTETSTCFRLAINMQNGVWMPNRPL